MTIIFDDFKKLEIKIGKVISAEKVPDADKLIKFVFDLGMEERQILAGIAEAFPDPSVLVGKEMPILVNIEPRKIRGYESQGMVMVAIADDKPILLQPETEVPPGSVIR
ncbi:methionine--tRNA ligase [Candidatus Parcubacteria bacterium]|nr:methionine--tRNA ligase [Candidatus Parcubacteria bacterium]